MAGHRASEYATPIVGSDRHWPLEAMQNDTLAIGYQQAARFGDRSQHGFAVQRHQRTQVEHLDADAVAGYVFGGADSLFGGADSPAHEFFGGRKLRLAPQGYLPWTPRSDRLCLITLNPHPRPRT